MPLVFTKDDIKQQLEIFGIVGLPDEELKGFIKDLKKLIKNEEKKRHLTSEGFDESDTSNVENSPWSSIKGESNSSSGSSPVVFIRSSQLIPPADVSDKRDQHEFTRAKVDIPIATARKDPIQNRVLRDMQQTHQSNTINDKTPRNVPRSKLQNRPKEATSTPTSAAVEIAGTNFQNELEDDSSSDEDSSSSSSLSQERPRIKLPPKSVRHDPVALYHFYKSFWDKQKCPGEDPRMQLRWNVRAGTMGRIPCDPDGIPTKYLRR